MNILELLEEIRLNTPTRDGYNLNKLNKAFNNKLKEIFTPSMLKKIYRFAPKQVRIKEMKSSQKVNGSVIVKNNDTNLQIPGKEVMNL